MTDRIEAALAALDKVTPGKWMPSMHQAVEAEKPDGTIKTVCICSPIDATLIAAAPDLAAEVIRLRKWQAEAKEILSAVRINTCQQYAYMKATKAHRGECETLREIQINLDRLIAEAEGE